MFFFLGMFYFTDELYIKRLTLTGKISSFECERNAEVQSMNDLINLIRRNHNLDNSLAQRSIENKRINIQELNNRIFALKKERDDLDR